MKAFTLEVIQDARTQRWMAVVRVDGQRFGAQYDESFHLSQEALLQAILQSTYKTLREGEGPYYCWCGAHRGMPHGVLLTTANGGR